MIVPLRRIALLAVTGVSLYLVAPALLDTFSSWQRLRDIWPGAVALIVALEFASLACVCLLQRLALQRPRWLPVVTSQLAGNAAAKIVPGGGAVGAALQYGMLRKAGLPGAATASGLTAANLLTLGTLLALPLLAVPAILLGPPIPEDLLQGLWVALGALAILFAVGAVLLVADRPLRRVGAAIQAVRNSVLRKRAPVDGLPERLVRERDLILGVLGHSRWEALAGSIGRWLLDYGALLVAVRAVGSDSRALLVLLAFVTAQVLAQIPITPGGLGFVEAGLTAMLVLAGVGAADAALATLAYRLASYWLPLPAGAAAWGIHAWRYRERPAAQGGSLSAAGGTAALLRSRPQVRILLGALVERRRSSARCSAARVLRACEETPARKSVRSRATRRTGVMARTVAIRG